MWLLIGIVILVILSIVLGISMSSSDPEFGEGSAIIVGISLGYGVYWLIKEINGKEGCLSYIIGIIVGIASICLIVSSRDALMIVGSIAVAAIAIGIGVYLYRENRQ